jgi:allophanate hydrolase
MCSADCADYLYDRQVEADPVTLNSNLGIYTNFVNLLDLAAIACAHGYA